MRKRMATGLGFAVIFLPWVAYAALSGSLDESAILERLKPDAKIKIEYGDVQPQTTVLSADIGKKRYEYTCKMCHGAGVAGAPKLSDKSLWQPRLSQGLETLVKHVIEGYKAMPPKGGCLNCSDEEIRKAVEYMLSQLK